MPGTIVIASAFDADVLPSATATVNSYRPADVGLPAMWPSADSVKPGGS
jgi:hypothetical protein